MRDGFILCCWRGHVGRGVKVAGAGEKTVGSVRFGSVRFFYGGRAGYNVCVSLPVPLIGSGESLREKIS